MGTQYVTKPKPADPYRVDSRATYNVPKQPVTTNIDDGPSLLATSGVRANNDYPPASGY